MRIPSGASSSCAFGLKTTARAAQRRLPSNCFYYYRRYVDRSFLFSSLYDQTDYVVNRCGIALHISRHLQFIRATHNIHVGSIIVGHSIFHKRTRDGLHYLTKSCFNYCQLRTNLFVLNQISRP